VFVNTTDKKVQVDRLTLGSGWRGGGYTGRTGRINTCKVQLEEANRSKAGQGGGSTRGVGELLLTYPEMMRNQRRLYGIVKTVFYILNSI